MRYFSLLSRDTATSPWSISFGDYERAVVKDELQDYKDQGFKASNLCIVETDDRDGQEALNNLVAAKNGGCQC